MVNRGKSNGTPIRLLWVINCTGYPNNTERKKIPLHYIDTKNINNSIDTRVEKAQKKPQKFCTKKISWASCTTKIPLGPVFDFCHFFRHCLVF